VQVRRSVPVLKPFTNDNLEVPQQQNGVSSPLSFATLLKMALKVATLFQKVLFGNIVLKYHKQKVKFKIKSTQPDRVCKASTNSRDSLKSLVTNALMKLVKKKKRAVGRRACIFSPKQSGFE